MASRFGQMDINLNYKHNDIFNSSFHGDPALLSARDPRTNLFYSKGQRDVLRPHNVDKYRDSSVRQHTWGPKESSEDDVEYFNSLSKEILKTQQNMKGKWFIEEKTKENNPKKEPNEKAIRSMSQKPLDKQMDISQKKDLQIAKEIWRNVLQQREDYNKDLKKQVEDKSKRNQLENLLNLTTGISGIIIGQNDKGVNVEQCAKDLRARAKVKHYEQSLERSISKGISNRDCSLENSKEYPRLAQSYNRFFLNDTNKTFYNERSVISSQRGHKKENSQNRVNSQTSERRTAKSASRVVTEGTPIKKSKEKEYLKFLTNSTEDKYYVKKVFHQKLRDFINEESRKVEEYTVKVLEERKQKKALVMSGIKDQITQDHERKTRGILRERQMEKQDETYRNDLVSARMVESAQTKEALLLQIAKKQQDKLQERRNSVKSGKQGYDKEGRKNRLLNDTVQKLLKKNASFLENVK